MSSWTNPGARAPRRAQVALSDVGAVLDAYAAAGVAASVVGSVLAEPRVAVGVGEGGAPALAGGTADLRDAWEATGFRLERLQAAAECVDAEQRGLAGRAAPRRAALKSVGPALPAGNAHLRLGSRQAPCEVAAGLRGLPGR